jgi:hypothetical protein
MPGHIIEQKQEASTPAGSKTSKESFRKLKTGFYKIHSETCFRSWPGATARKM